MPGGIPEPPPTRTITSFWPAAPALHPSSLHGQVTRKSRPNLEAAVHGWLRRVLAVGIEKPAPLNASVEKAAQHAALRDVLLMARSSAVQRAETRATPPRSCRIQGGQVRRSRIPLGRQDRRASSGVGGPQVYRNGKNNRIRRHVSCLSRLCFFIHDRAPRMIAQYIANGPAWIGPIRSSNACPPRRGAYPP